LYKIYRLLWFISNRDYIPKLPRGMLASKYDETQVTRDEWRVLDRTGARDPAGIKRAMKRYKVDNIDDLVALLEHHQPKRKPFHRLKRALGRLVGEYNYDPHAREVKQAFKYHLESQAHIRIKERIRKAK
ncbi:MAG: hypothetical protein CUN56_16560, partial [Phototrophicales bacterium]